MKTAFLVIGVCVGHLGFAQVVGDTLAPAERNRRENQFNKLDSVNTDFNSKLNDIELRGDSTSRTALYKADSIRSGFQSKVDSLQLAYRVPMNKMDSVSRGLQHKIDSLQTLHLPTDKLNSKLDSVNRLQTQKLSELNHKVDVLKTKATASLKSMELPPQLQEPVQKLTQSIDGYKIPMVNGKIPSLSATTGKIPGHQLPNGKLNMSSLGNTQIPGLKEITSETKEISKVSGEVSGYSKDVQNLAKGKTEEVKHLDKDAEAEALKMQGVGDLKRKAAELDKYKSQLNGKPDSMALKMAKQEALQYTREATSHFAGQEVVLQNAMDKMSKLKTKYSKVKSMAELPKKLPNPLHDTPFIERLVPGLTFQLLKSQSVLLDVNVLALYRITPRLSSGAGWVERVVFDTKKQNSTSVYGPRAAFQFNLSKGFSLRFQPELLNTFVPPQLIPSGTDGVREWVWSAFVGIKKDFGVMKFIRGNTEVMYNLYDPQNKSPYTDRLVVRFGFEFPMKKKVRKVK